MIVSPARLVDLYRQMLRIRRLQERIESEYHLDEMKTPVHLCIGQEAVAVGVCAALRSDDYIMSNHRGHGHYLAKGGDLDALVAELFCRSTGCSQGRAGSMHLVDTRVGHLGSSSIVGGGIPLGTGLGLACRMQGLDRVSVIFFGDGAADEGVLYESLNLAMLKKLPVVYVLENNHYSVCSPVASRHSGGSVFHGLEPERLFTARVDGNKVEDVLAAAERAVARARAGEGPSFIECLTYRLRGHAGAGSDAHLGYRPEGEIETWQRRDPVITLGQRLLAVGHLDRAVIKAMDEVIAAELDQAFTLAKASPLPGAEDLALHLFSE
jgi:pyruvate dehydrogenase E1 component alpha subunit